MGKIHSTKEWKEKRDSVISDDSECEWCGSKENLCVHHPEHIHLSPREITRKMLRQFDREFWKEFIEENNIKMVEGDKHRHNSHDYWHPTKRKHKDCEHVESENIVCRMELGITEAQIEQAKVDCIKWFEDNNCQSKIDEAIQKSNEKYMSMEDTQILCKRCHFAHHRGMNLCPICKTKYKKKHYSTCYDCMDADKKNAIEEKKYIDNLMKEAEEMEDFDDI